MPFKIMRNDITKVNADVIVNTANTDPVIGSGTDTGIYNAAGREKLLKARKIVGKIEPGDIAVTDAFNLPAKYIIHAVNIPWQGGDKNEEGILRSCYRKSMAMAEKLGANSIAFPTMGSGKHRFEKGKALDIALSEIREFLKTSDMEVILVIFGTETFTLSEHLLGSIESYIDANYVEETHARENPSRDWMDYERTKYKIYFGDDIGGDESDQFRGEEAYIEEESFTQRLNRYIDKSGEDWLYIYRRANIDRKNASRILNGKITRPNKNDCIAIAMALYLSYEETVDFIARADWAFNPSSKFDNIIRNYIKAGKYEIIDLDAILFKYTERTLSRV